MKQNCVRIKPDAWTVLVCFFLICVPDCYQEEEGCLDVRATNLDVSADLPCLDCCDYPSLRFIIQHRAIFAQDTQVLSYDSSYTLPNLPAAPFRINRVQYYLSDIELLEAGGASIRVTDSVELCERQFLNPDCFERIDDFILVERSRPTSYAVGGIQATGTIVGLRFKVGLDNEVRSTDPEVLPAIHPLAWLADSTNWEQAVGYRSTFFRYFPDTLSTTDSLLVPVFEAVTVELSLSEPFQVVAGSDISVTLLVDYLSWLRGLNMGAAEPQDVAANIVTNLSNSFALVGIKED